MPDRVRLVVYDLLGRSVRTLLEGSLAPCARGDLGWTKRRGRAASGRGVPAAVGSRSKGAEPDNYPASI